MHSCATTTHSSLRATSFDVSSSVLDSASFATSEFIAFLCVSQSLRLRLTRGCSARIGRRCDARISGALKPFVCESSLCLYQYLNLGLGLSIEQEIITNASVVDLLAQLAYVSAKEGRMKAEAFPNGLGLEVPATKTDGTWKKGDAVDDFDSLESDLERQTGVASLILELPPIVRAGSPSSLTRMETR